MSSAFRAIQKFRVHELNGLRAHIKRFGPLLGQTSLPLPSPVILPNPFLPRLNPKTGRWAPPKYSLRRQAELIKKAKASNMLDLLPPGPKFVANAAGDAPEAEVMGAWARSAVWESTVKVKEPAVSSRLYIGRKRMFKGHKLERTMAARETRRTILMRDMKKRITTFKTVCTCSSRLFALDLLSSFVK
jgi:large subunit ribosomal protein L25